MSVGATGGTVLVGTGGDSAGGRTVSTGGIWACATYPVEPDPEFDCTYPMPPPSVDIPVDFETGTQVLYYAAGADPATVPGDGVVLHHRYGVGVGDPNCADPDSNGDVGTGWYYTQWNELKEPVEFALCPTTCDRVRADVDAKMTVVVECICAC